MADWYYYNASGEKVGPVRGRDLKRLIQEGTITPDTTIEDSAGRTAPAKKVKGLPFAEATLVPSVEPDTFEDSMPMDENPFIMPFPVEPNSFSSISLPPVSMKDSTDMTVDYCDFIHPEDEIAMKRLRAVPGLQTVTKWFLDLFGDGDFFHGMSMATRIRLSPTQLPELYKHLPPICRKFGIAEPEFYLERGAPNAYTCGSKRTFLVVTSGLLTLVKNDEELAAVLAHECGHILCRHVFYNTMASMLTIAAGALGVLGKLAVPVQLALNYWSRRSELSADRASLVYLGDSAPMRGVLARLAGGPMEITGNINFDEFAAQAEGYLDLSNNSKWHKFLQTLAIMDQSHPFYAVRFHELKKWEGSEQYLRLRAALNKEGGFANKDDGHPCSHCGCTIETQHKFCPYCGEAQ